MFNHTWDPAALHAHNQEPRTIKLEAKGCACHLDSCLQLPAKADPPSALAAELRCQALVQGWLQR